MYKSVRKPIAAILAAVAIAAAPAASAQFSLSRALQGLSKIVQSSQISDEQLAAYVRQSVD